MHELSALEFGDAGEQVAELHQALDLLDLGASITPPERIAARYLHGTQAAVESLQTRLGRSDGAPGRFDERCAAAVNEFLRQEGWLGTYGGDGADGGPPYGDTFADGGPHYVEAQADGLRAGAGEWTVIALPDAVASDGSGVAAVSRFESHMEAWWLGRPVQGRIQGAFRYVDTADDWQSYTVRNQILTPSPSGGVAAVSRDDAHMEVWWIGPDQSVLGAYWPNDNRDWEPYRLTSVLLGRIASSRTGIGAVSRSRDHLEIWWVADDGSVHGAWWEERDPRVWNHYLLPGAGERSASASGGLAAVSRSAMTMDVLWVGARGEVRHAAWDGQAGGWNPQIKEVAGRNEAAQAHTIAAVSRTEGSIDAVWVTEQGAVRGARWTAGSDWRPYDNLLAADGASTAGGIAAVKGFNDSMDVVWITDDGGVKGTSWSPDTSWQSYTVAEDHQVSTRGGIAATARTATTTEVWWAAPDGAVQFAVRNDMPSTDWVVHGVVRTDDPHPLTVKAFDANHVGADSLGDTPTGDGGAYRIVYRPPQAVPGAEQDVPADFALVVAAYTTDGRQVARSAPKPRPDRVEEINLDVTDTAPARTVRGTVVDTDGRPVPRVVVKVLDRDIGSARDLLGETRPTGTDGAFSVQYQVADFKHGDFEPPTADVLFELTRDGANVSKFRVQRLPVGEADVITATVPVSDGELALGIVARDDELVTITVTEVTGTPVGPSEYQRVITALEKITSRDNIVNFDEAAHRDFSFAARETGIDFVLIDAMVAAHKLQKTLGATVSRQACYAVVRHAGTRTANALAALLVSDIAAALDTAVKGTIDPLDQPSSVVATALHDAAVGAALNPDPTNTSVTTPLNHAIAQPQVRSAVLQILVDPPDGDVWEHIKDHHPQVDVGLLQYSLQLSALVNDNEPLFKEITKKLPNVNSMDTLVRQLDDATLAAAVKDAGAMPDDGPPGEQPDDAQARLTGMLRRLMDAAQPTAAVARTFAQIHASTPEVVDAPTSQFLDELATNKIDLATADLTGMTERSAGLLDRLADDDQRAAALDGALRAQRLFRISSDAADLGLLASTRDVTGKPFGGAVDIGRLGRAAFLARFPTATAVERVALDQIHTRAQTFADSLSHLLIAEHQDNRPDQIRSAASGLDYQSPSSQMRASADGTASWTDIFGSEEQCECDECRSVIGPAAYLVDLFEFLDKRCLPDDHNITLLDRLIGHPTKKDENGNAITGLRPDLAYIKLTCQNVNTTMPFIDVINQILESVIAFNGSVIPLDDKGNLVPNELSPGVTSAQLSAAPEHVIEEAYNTLAAAVYPIGLPYDRRLDTARTWMRQVGVERAPALRTFGKSADVTAAEVLGLYRRDWEINTGEGYGGAAPQSPVPTVCELYGVPCSHQTHDANTTIDALDDTRVVLRALGITFERLVEVLRTDFVGGLVPDADDPGVAARILLTVKQLKALREADYQTTDPDILNALALGGITGEDVEAFDAAHPGGTIVLDPSISCDPAAVQLRHLDDTAPGAGEWLQIHRLVRLSTRSGIAPADLDVALTAVGVTNKIINRAVLRDLADLARLRGILGVDWPRAAAVVSRISTRGRANLYDELFVDSGLSQVHPVLGRGSAGRLVYNQSVSLKTIASAIASVLRWSSDELTAVAEVLTLTDVTLADVSKLYRYAILARTLKVSPLDAVRLHILLAPAWGPDPTITFIERAARSIGLQVGVPAIETLIIEPTDTSGDDAAVKAATAALAKLTSRLSAAGTGSDSAEAKKIVVDTVAKEYEIDADSAAQLIDASAKLATLPFKPTPQQLNDTLPELTRTARLAAVIRGLAGAGPALCDALARPNRPVKQALQAMIGSATQTTRLEIVDDMGRFGELTRRVGRPKQLSDAVKEIIANSPALDAAIAAWLEVTEQQATAIRTAGPLGQPAAPLEYLGVLADISRTAARFGIEPKQVGDALSEPVYQAAVDVLLTGVSSHYSSSSWLELSKQLTDPIRERSRDALVAYLKRRDGMADDTDDTDLFARYLVDVGRDSFVLTSPIQQATFAVHTFVQRCQLGMYLPVMRTQIDNEEWLVEGTYPVWASRMMTFLWPEQILNPAWRDNKSPAFMELETALRQGDVTEANARRALEQYLESMAVTASLEICGTYLQDKFKGSDAKRFITILHIVGRTRTSPRRYFYRRLETYQHHEEWSDWEPIGTDIESMEQDRVEGRVQDSDPPQPVPGVHVLPVVWRDAVYLFWATLVRKVDTPKKEPMVDVAAQRIEGRFSRPYWEIKLNYTRRDPAGWTPKTQWPAMVETWTAPFTFIFTTPGQPMLYAPESLLLHAKTVTDDALEISVAQRIDPQLSCLNPLGDKVRTALLYTFATTGPHARVTSGFEEQLSLWNYLTAGPKVLPGGDHPALKGAVAGDFQAISVSGDLSAVASADKVAGDRLFTAPTLMRMNSPTQAWPEPLRAPLLLDLGDKVYFARTAAGTTTILQKIVAPPDNGRLVYPFFRDTVINAVSEPLAGPGVIDLPKTREMARIRAVTEADRISAVKANAALSIKAPNPWVNSKALAIATTDFSRPPVTSAAAAAMPLALVDGMADVTATADARWYGGWWGWSWGWGLGEWWNWWRTRSLPAVDLSVIPFSNPFVDLYQSALRTGGLDALYDPKVQELQLPPTQTFKGRCNPNPNRVTTPDAEGVEFAITAPCGRQHWELFFHVPALLQDLQRDNKHLDAALTTMRRIYDPMSPVRDPQDVWRFKPFRDAQPVRVDELLARLNRPVGDKEREEVEAQLDQMRHFPFQGHRIARLRPIAYKRWLVAEFVQLLIELTDRELRAFTPESVNRSFLYCLVAAAIMGPRPDRVRPRAAMAPRSYAELRPLLDASGNIWLTAETKVGAAPVATTGAAPDPGVAINMGRRASIGYFGIPRNKKLHALWDLVADRLFKLRHGMNIDGVRVQLPLFLPPIDPAVLAAAIGAGADLDAVLQMLAAERPRYRFVVAHREAVTAAQHLITLGEALLQAYTQRDAESLARLTATQQKDMAQQILDARAKAVQVAEAELADAEQQRHAHLQMWRHYRDLLGIRLNEPGPQPDNTGYAAAQRRLNLVQSSSVNFASLQVIPDIAKGVAFLTGGPAALDQLELIDASVGGVKMAPGMMLAEEKQELESSFEAVKLSFDAALLETLAGAVGLIPNFEGAVKPFGAGAAIHFGGQALAAIARAAAGNKNTAGGMHRFLAQVFAKQATLVLREREWILGLNQAAAHVHEVDKRVAVTRVRVELAKAEQSTQSLALQHAEQVKTYLETQKFSRLELFDQRLKQLRDLYRRIADIGFDLTREAQVCYQAERDQDKLPEFKVGPAASAEAELLSGHQLLAFLEEMNRTFLATAPTGPQLTKHISLREINPEQLHLLRETGSATFKIDELWFDLDHPDHYDRRIMSVGVSIPCVTGPMTGVGGTLTLTGARRRTKANPGSFTESNRTGVTTAIALSSGRDDSGRFELRPDDPLYNPFEGLGAISDWTLNLPMKLRKFNYRTISDVILTIRYTAEAGGASRENDWVEAFKRAMPGGTAVQLMSLRHDRPDAWASFLATKKLRVPAPVDMLPHVLRHFPGVTPQLTAGAALPLLVDTPATAGWKTATVDGGDLVVNDLGVDDVSTLDDVAVRAWFSL